MSQVIHIHKVRPWLFKQQLKAEASPYKRKSAHQSGYMRGVHILSCKYLLDWEISDECSVRAHCRLASRRLGELLCRDQ